MLKIFLAWLREVLPMGEDKAFLISFFVSGLRMSAFIVSILLCDWLILLYYHSPSHFNLRNVVELIPTLTLN